MMIGSRYTNRKRRRINLSAGSEQLEDDFSIKILGWWLSPDGKLDLHLSKIRGAVCKVLAGLKPFLKVLDLKRRRKLVYQKDLSIADYGLPLYIGQCESTKDKIS